MVNFTLCTFYHNLRKTFNGGGEAQAARKKYIINQTSSKFKTLYIKGHNQPSPKATYPMGDNNCNHISDKKLIPRIYKEL